MLERIQQLGLAGRLALWISVGVIGTILATTAFGETIPNFAARENDRVNAIKGEYNDFLILANREYCLPAISDLKEKIEIKKPLGETAGELETEWKLLATNSGCTKAIE